VVSLNSAKRGGLDLRDWWKSFGGAASLVVPTAQVDRVLEHKGKWREVSDALDAISSSSNLGDHMFRFAHRLVKSEDLALSMNAEIARLSRG
jgi:hypothetical protein